MTNEKLVECIQASDKKKEHLHQLWKQNYPLIVSLASKYGNHENCEDLLQEGYMGLHAAAMNYDLQGKALFITYAVYWVKQKMIQYLKKNYSAARFPSYMVELITKYKKVSGQFQKEYGREPSKEEYKALLDVSDREFRNIQKAVYTSIAHSLNESMSMEDSETELEDLIPANMNIENDTAHKIDHEKMSKILWTLIGQLPDSEAEVITKRYQDELSAKEVGDLFGLTEKQINNINADARRRIRMSPAGKELREYYIQYM